MDFYKYRAEVLLGSFVNANRGSHFFCARWWIDSFALNNYQSMAKNGSLTAARDAKQDEFYTQLDDISNELKHYTQHFQGKVVLCNCDDPTTSNFFHLMTQRK